MNTVTTNCRFCGAEVEERREVRHGSVTRFYECDRCGYAWGSSIAAAQPTEKRQAKAVAK